MNEQSECTCGPGDACDKCGGGHSNPIHPVRTPQFTEAIARAQQTIQHSVKTHLDWIEHLEKHPYDPAVEIAGSLAEHRELVTDYEKVQAVIKALLSETYWLNLERVLLVAEHDERAEMKRIQDEPPSAEKLAAEADDEREAERVREADIGANLPAGFLDKP